MQRRLTNKVDSLLEKLVKKQEQKKVSLKRKYTHPCLKLFMLSNLLISSGSFFHNDGPIYNALLKSLFVFLKGCVNL